MFVIFSFRFFKKNSITAIVGLKSQIAMEYLIIMGLILFITIPSVIIYSTQSDRMREEVSLNQAQVAIRKIVDSSESVFYQGPPSKDTLKIYFPEGITNVTVLRNEIIIVINGRELYEFSEVPLKGTFFASSGIHEISFTAGFDVNGTFVSINGN